MTETDEKLWALIKNTPTDIDIMRTAIEAGANVNSTNAEGESVLMKALFFEEENSLEVVRLLCDCGADVNFYDPDDFCPLAEAFYWHDPKIIDCLLHYGANPNVLVERIKPSSILDIAVTDLGFHEMACRDAIDIEFDKRACEAVSKIIDLLMAAGAKFSKDMIAPRPQTWLVVDPHYKTGMVTREGLLHVADLPTVSEAFCRRFNDWLAHFFNTWPDCNFDAMPVDFNRKAHNAEGLLLAEEIHRMIGSMIEMEYSYICAESESQKVRNVLRQKIG